MALATYRAVYQNIAFGNLKNMAHILNAAGSGMIVKVWRIWCLNNNLTAVTGVMLNLDLKRITDITSPTAVTPVFHDTTNGAIPAQVTAGYAGTIVGEGDLLRRISWSSDEPAVSAAGNDEWECLVPLNCIWDAGYGDVNVQPIILREGEGLTLKCITNTVASFLDTEFEFTLETP
jgi:hypothetical protein